jgi:hypothetical protein
MPPRQKARNILIPFLKTCWSIPPKKIAQNATRIGGTIIDANVNPISGLKIFAVKVHLISNDTVHVLFSATI